MFEDKDAIREVLALYCHYGDTLDYERWLDLFTDDCVFEIGDDQRHEGKRALREFVTARRPADGVGRLRHCVMNEVIEVRGDRAHALSYILELRHEDDGTLRNRLAGRYEDDLLRQGARWRIQRRRVHLDILGKREPTGTGGRSLGHVELVYRPGERALAGQLFETLGCKVIETGGPYLVIQIRPGSKSFLDDVLYASEVTPEQWAFEDQLQRVLTSSTALHHSHHAFTAQRTRAPQCTTHFGIRLESPEELEQILKRIETAPPPELAGRLSVSGVFRPGDPGALSDRLIQAFVRTDVCAAGLLTLGQLIELQVDLPS